MDQRFAMLIDADNVSPKYIKGIIDELAQYGVVTYKRIYGDWTNTQNSAWKEVLLNNSITPIQQYSYTYGKNATDSAMIIDAMDILYTKSVEGFCIISSDSDFTKLASRLRESGVMVIGMGEDKTPTPFRKACDKFTRLEMLNESDKDDKTVQEITVKTKIKGVDTKEKNIKDSSESIISKDVIENQIIKIIAENKNENFTTGLGEIGSRLQKVYPEFDVRNYGYNLLSKFLEEFKNLSIIKNGHSITVELKEDNASKDLVETHIMKLVAAAGPTGMELAELGKKIHDKYDDFDVRNYGYSQFIKYVRSIKDLEIKEIESGHRVISKGSKLL